MLSVSLDGLHVCVGLNGDLAICDLLWRKSFVQFISFVIHFRSGICYQTSVFVSIDHSIKSRGTLPDNEIVQNAPSRHVQMRIGIRRFLENYCLNACSLFCFDFNQLCLFSFVESSHVVAFVSLFFVSCKYYAGVQV